MVFHIKNHKYVNEDISWNQASYKVREKMWY